MTTKALELLENDKGFFLQVEGASIDKQDHSANACGQIGETVAFDKAIGVALDYQQLHPDTLVVVTADHAHTSQIVPVPGNEPLGRPGNLSTLLTKGDQSMMTINYATRSHGQSQDHTGSEVRIAAQGPQAASVVGVTNQTDLFHTMARALGLE
jgi:alkaline phosphatase